MKKRSSFHSVDKTVSAESPMLERRSPVYFAERVSIHGVADFYKANTVWERLLWILLLLVAVGFASFQSYATLISYIAKETGTRFITADRSKPHIISDMVRFVYCPQNWLSLDKVEESGFDKVLLLFALSNIPFVDPWAMASLYQTFSRSQRQTVRFEEDSPAFWDSLADTVRLQGQLPVQAKQFDFRNASVNRLWTELKIKMGDINLAIFLSKFTESNLISNIQNYSNWSEAYDANEPYTFRFGRLCQNIKAVSKQFEYQGEAHDYFVFTFLYKPVDNMPKPKFMISPYLGIEIGNTHQEMMYTDIFDSQYNLFYPNVSDPQKGNFFITSYRIKVKIWQYLDLARDPCASINKNGQRYQAGHSILNCQHLCYDYTHRKMLHKTSKQGSCTLLRNYSTLRPCSSARFRGQSDKDERYLKNNAPLQKEFDKCVQERQCFRRKDCEDWLVDLDEYYVPGRPGQYTTKDKPNGKEYLQATFHKVEITFRSGAKYVDYLLVNDYTFIGGIGGIFGLFIGASLISIVQVILYFIKYWCHKLAYQRQFNDFTTAATTTTTTHFS